MSEEKKDIIETLLAKEGKNPGECIGTYGRRCIVFLPRGVKPNSNVRVKLLEIGKEDGRGNPMYRGVPAPDLAGEIWREAENGNICRVETATNWLGETREVRVAETRPLTAREAAPALCNKQVKPVWGTDFASSVMEWELFHDIALEKEVVQGGKLLWTKVGSRQEPVPTRTFPITAVEVVPSKGTISSAAPGGGTFRIPTSWVYNPNYTKAYVRIVAHGCPHSSGEWRKEEEIEWASLPQWWRDAHEAAYPLCSCGRRRIDREDCSDGYGKCEQCRIDAERCVRCGKQTKIAVMNGRLVCDPCRPHEDAEQAIARSVTAGHKLAIAEEAKVLRAGRTFNTEEGMAILKAMTISSPVAHRCFYFHEDGSIYGSSLDPAQLQLLEYLTHASGNGLVELVSWVGNPARVAEKLDRRESVLAEQIRGPWRAKKAPPARGAAPAPSPRRAGDGDVTDEDILALKRKLEGWE